jgi:integrase/recombinase XerD
MTILHELFVRVHSRYTRSPHVGELSSFAHWLIERECAMRHAQRLVFRAMRSLEVSGLPPDRMWTDDELDRAFHHTRYRLVYRQARHSFGKFLQSVGRLTPRRKHNPHAELLATYQSYLSEVRGLVTTTIVQHIAEVDGLLRHLLPKGKPLKQLTAKSIEKHIERRAQTLSRHTLRTSVGYLRAFLVYCFERRLIPGRLDFIDKPVGLRNELPPRALDWPVIQRLLSSIDRTDRGGWRDFMMLHLMAHYGLRPGEVAHLTLESIDWTARTLLVQQQKTHSWLTLPLQDQSLGLLRRYLKEGRRQSRRAELFLATSTPYGPLSKASVTHLFKNRVRKSGLPIPHAFPYSLRHSFAMRLFKRKVGIKTIGDLLGHQSIASTAVYLRLQTDVLREVALPVPTAAKLRGGAA